MGKKILILSILALALPMAAFADSQLDFNNSGGTLVGGSSGLSLTGSTLSASGAGGWGGFNLGTLSFSTGSLTSGNASWGGTFSGGGNVTISGIGGGVVFSGTFSGPVNWNMTTGIDGTHTYTLSGIVNGTAAGGISVGDVNVTFSINTGKGYFSGQAGRVGGNTTVTLVTQVPEPGSLTLMGMGMLGLGGAVRRKLRKQV